jgi:small-conductance mechanosensitive channel
MPDTMNTLFLDIPLWRWATFGGTLVVGWAVAWIVRRVLLRTLRRLTARTQTVWDDAFIEAIQSTRGVFLVVIITALALQVLPLDDGVTSVIHAVASVAVVLMGGTWLNKTMRGVLQRWSEQDRLDGHRATLVTALGFVTRLVVWSIVVLLVLSNLGIEVSALLAGLGVGGVAAALAVQSTLGDTIAAFSIYVDRPFDIGDFVIVGTDLGTVTSVGWRSSRIASLSGEELVVPNSDIARSRIRNMKRMAERRVVTRLGIVYRTATESVEQAPVLLREAVEAVEGARFDRAHFSGFGPSSLDMELVWFVLAPEYNVYMDRQQEILLGIVRRFREHGLEFAFPSQTIYVAEVPEAMLGRAAE